MRVKICGMMRREDVEAALDNGADAIGFVVGTPASQRNLRLQKARILMKSAPVFTTKVAVTSTPHPKLLQKICTTLNPQALQLHRYAPKTVYLLRKRNPEMKIILATAIREKQSIFDAEQTIRYSDAILADSPGQSAMGGTGKAHDWKLTAELRRRIGPHPLILAGGLTADNVRLAIRRVRPYAVDVSSGVEKRMGIKDHRKMKEFIMNAKEIETSS
jgi:phosphoribosylanthranilate isomerase